MTNFLLATGLVAALVVVLMMVRLWRTLRWVHGAVATDLAPMLANARAQAEARAYLATLLQQPPETLPPMGGWAASADFLVILAETVLARRPETVVEFGSGVSTLVAARCLQLNGRGRLLTFDHDAAFAEVTRQRLQRLGLAGEVVAVPLGEPPSGYAGRWYDVADLPATIDLLVIDGPPKHNHPETRGGAAALFDRLRGPGAVVLLDDAARPGERAVAELWRERHPALAFAFIGTEKGTLIGRMES